MIISETFSLDARRDRVAEMLLDVEGIRSCVPGVGDVTRVSAEGYEATLSVQVGPIKTAFRGSITIDDSESPERLRATARGKDRASGSLATVDFDARLREANPDTTTVETRADVTIRGRLGGFGTGVIQATAKQMIEDFATCVNARLSSEGAEPPPGPTRPLPVLRLFFAGLWARLRSAFRREKIRS